MHIALLAGEPSGDQLGAELIKSLKKLDNNIYFDGIGGPLMQEQGFHSLLPISDFSVMGISEILLALPRLLGHKRKILKHYQQKVPDIFIGIDYPEFNLNIEKTLKSKGVITAHYVSPSVWAWREKRIHHIKESCDLMLTLFDFEKQFYDKHDLPAVHCGHPLVDMIPEKLSIDEARQKLNLPIESSLNYLAILPGSRQSEVRKMLPVFIETVGKLQVLLPDLHCLIPCANEELASEITQIMQTHDSDISYQLINQQAKTAMLAADAVLLASGTAALEAMLLQKPMLVSYKVSGFTAMLAKRLVNVEHFSLPNLLAGKQIVPEFMQDKIDADKMAKCLAQLILPTPTRQQMIDELIQTRYQLRENGADTAAQAIYQLVTQQTQNTVIQSK